MNWLVIRVLTTGVVLLRMAMARLERPSRWQALPPDILLRQYVYLFQARLKKLKQYCCGIALKTSGSIECKSEHAVKP